jgi:hypothetical protein
MPKHRKQKAPNQGYRFRIGTALWPAFRVRRAPQLETRFERVPDIKRSPAPASRRKFRPFNSWLGVGKTMRSRPDISDRVVHFTRGVDFEDAFANLKSIIDDRKLVGSGTKIRGAHSCVCFTEAPIDFLPNGLVSPESFARYSLFGITVAKDWLFRRGGRPVIYQSDSEYGQLSSSLQWRHMRYEPGTVDFTWEREWRINCLDMPFEPHEARIVVPDDYWLGRLVSEHDVHQSYQVLEYSQIMDDDFAEQYREPFPWLVACLPAEEDDT